MGETPDSETRELSKELKDFLARAAKAAYDNAKSHTVSSEKLRRVGNFPLACAIVVLAYEEVGKALVLRMASEGAMSVDQLKRIIGPPFGRVTHEGKQGVVTDLVIRVYTTARLLDAESERLGTEPTPDDHRRILGLWGQGPAIDDPSTILDDANQAIAASIVSDVSHLYKTLGDMERLKRTGLYVDVDVEARTLSSPTEIDLRDYHRIRTTLGLVVNTFGPMIEIGLPTELTSRLLQPATNRDADTLGTD
jgi:hypothetical protein